MVRKNNIHNRWKLLLTIIFQLLLSVNCFAIDFSHLYPRSDLIRVQEIYGQNIRAVLFKDIRHYLSITERQTLSTIEINIPLYDKDYGLFHYSMNLTTRTMTITALSVKFFDDLAIAFAWYERHNLDKRKIIEYVLKLYSNQQQIRPPLLALGVPAKAWESDSYVDDVSQKILKSGIAFLLLHEFAHWHYRHSPYNVISLRRAQEQEKQADAFALDVMARMHTIPYGMVPWFMVTSLLQSNEAKTHPVSSDRLYAIADRIEQNPIEFIGKENINRIKIEDVKKVALDIKTIAYTIEKK